MYPRIRKARMKENFYLIILIDLLVYQETILKGRRVYLDFTENTKQQDILFESLSTEAYEYLRQADALFGTPIERVKQMNEPAIQFYQDHKVNLYEEKLEIAICAQHNNGGLAIQEAAMEGDECIAKWRPVRPIPEVDYFFENQWKLYRNRFRD